MLFLLALVLVHTPVALAAGFILARWHGRMKRRMPVGLWLLYLAADATVLGLGVLAGTVLLLVGARSGPLLARFWAQILFGELPLLLFAAGGMQLRAAAQNRLPRWRGSALIMGALALLWTYYEAYHRCPYDLQVRHHSLDRVRNGKQTGKLRILHLTDLQTHAIRDYERRAFRTAASLKPDLIVFTGDYVQSRQGSSRKEAGAALRAFLRQEPLRARYGAFAVRGDHERDDWTALFEGTGFRCLSDETVMIPLEGGRTLRLTGLSPAVSRKAETAELMETVGPARAGELHFVIGHAPDFVSQLPARSGVDLALAGHTHGGQVVIPGMGPLTILSRLPRRYGGGLNWFGDVPLHVSRGIGMERGLAPQVRFFCPPEICLVEVGY